MQHVAVAHDERLDFVDITSARLTATWTAPSEIHVLARIGDLALFVVADDDGRVWTLDPRSGSDPVSPAKLLKAPPWAMLTLSSSRGVLIVDATGVWLVEPSTGGRLTWIRLPQHDMELTAAAVTRDVLIAGDALGQLWRWDLASRPLPPPLRLYGLENAVAHIAVCQGARPWAIAVDQNGKASLLRFHPHRGIEGRHLPTRRPIRSVAMDDACTIAAASDGVSVELWNLRADKPEDATWSLPNRGPVHGVTISADGRELIAVGQTSARLWDLTNIARLPHVIHSPDESLMTALHLPDGRIVVATSSSMAWTEAPSM